MTVSFRLKLGNLILTIHVYDMKTIGSPYLCFINVCISWRMVVSIDALWSRFNKKETSPSVVADLHSTTKFSGSFGFHSPSGHKQMYR